MCWPPTTAENTYRFRIFVLEANILKIIMNYYIIIVFLSVKAKIEKNNLAINPLLCHLLVIISSFLNDCVPCILYTILYTALYQLVYQCKWQYVYRLLDVQDKCTTHVKSSQYWYTFLKYFRALFEIIHCKTLCWNFLPIS